MDLQCFELHYLFFSACSSTFPHQIGDAIEHSIYNPFVNNNKTHFHNFGIYSVLLRHTSIVDKLLLQYCNIYIFI